MEKHNHTKLVKQAQEFNWHFDSLILDGGFSQH
jgi:hypothetical protein